MDWKPIPKSPEKWRVQPNFTNDAKICSGFSWDEMRRELNGLPDERGLNIAYEAADRHASGERRDHVALRWLVADGTTCDISYWDLSAQSNRFANVLRELDAGKGGRVLALAGRIPDLLRRRARHAEEYARLLPALLRIRSGAGLPASEPR